MKKITKVLAVVLAFALVLGVFTACGNSNNNTTAAPTQAATEAATTAPAETAKEAATIGEYTGPEMELVVNIASAEQYMQEYVKIEERITERTGGKVTFFNYFSGAAASPTEALGAVQSGQVDISDVTLANYQDLFPYTEQVTGCPFMGFTGIPMASDIFREFVPAHEECLNEFTAQNVVPLFYVGVWGTSLCLADDVDVKVPTDLSGLKIASMSELEQAFLKDKCGATPVSQSVMDIAGNLQNNVIDGIMLGLYVVNMFGGLDFTERVYMLENSFTTGCRAFVINQDVWNSFDDTLKAIFLDEYGSDDFLAANAVGWGINDQSHLDKCDELGIPVTYITGDDMKAWRDAASEYTEKRLSDLEAKGYTEARKIYKELCDAIDNYDGMFAE